MEFTRNSQNAQHYLYVDRECPYGPEIAEAMGSGIGQVFGFLGEAGITPLTMPMTVYLGMDPQVLRFRAGVIVSEEDAGKASGEIKSDVLPAGDVIATTHVGPYDALNESHKALWSHMESEGIAAAMPVWEIYVDDPEETAPEALKTEIYRMVAAD